MLQEMSRFIFKRQNIGKSIGRSQSESGQNVRSRVFVLKRRLAKRFTLEQSVGHQTRVGDGAVIGDSLFRNRIHARHA